LSWRSSRRKFLKLTLAAGAVTAGALLGLVEIKGFRKKPPTPSSIYKSVVQTAVDGSKIPKFVEVLPVFAGSRVSAGKNTSLTVNNVEFQQKILPDSFYSKLPSPFQGGSYVWGYSIYDGAVTAGPSYPAVTIESVRGTPIQVNYVNSLTDTYLQKVVTVDQTIHWANPAGIDMQENELGLAMLDPLMMKPYSGPIPVVTHLHGGEVPSNSDGGPDAWFTPGNAQTGPAWKLGATSQYSYPNEQPATTLWFHDHTLGATRTNIYSGLVGVYFIRDEYDTGVPGTGLNLPAGPYEVELLIQDKMFDTNGQILFPDGTGANATTANTPNGPEDGAGFNGPPPNPSTHPYWIPEFFGDVILVNGKSWPYFDAEPRRYRLRFVNGANARFFNLTISGVQIWLIGTDGGLLDAPAAVDSIFIAPGERADVIVDFSALSGTSVVLTNDAVTPYPSGGSGPGQDPGPGPAGSSWFRETVGQVLMVNVGSTISGGTDTSYDPAASGATLRGGPNQPAKIVRLADGVGGIDPAATIDNFRMLTLVEVEGPGGPMDPIVNNTIWSGLKSDGTLDSGFVQVGANYISEMPRVGSTERWDLINLTEDAHPIHIHLIQFQLINRQNVNVGSDFDSGETLPGGYRALYNASFPSANFEPNNGPPFVYATPNSAGAIGGNPDVTPFLQGDVIPPNPWEVGWKDTIKVFPGQVTRVAIRWAPQETALGDSKPGENGYRFDPTSGPGYVWHCHIIDHEDNEMMRPYIPTN